MGDAEDNAGGARGESGDEGERALTGVAPGDDALAGPNLLFDTAVLSVRDGSLGLALACGFARLDVPGVLLCRGCCAMGRCGEGRAFAD